MKCNWECHEIWYELRMNWFNKTKTINKITWWQNLPLDLTYWVEWSTVYVWFFFRLSFNTFTLLFKESLDIGKERLHFILLFSLIVSFHIRGGKKQLYRIWIPAEILYFSLLSKYIWNWKRIKTWYNWKVQLIKWMTLETLRELSESKTRVNFH